MVYAIIAIAVIVALFLIFRDDHDKSYNKSEKGGHAKPQPAPRPVPKAEPKPSPKPQPAPFPEPAPVPEPEPEPSEEDWEDEPEPDLEFLEDLDYYEDLEENSETFDIAGLRYYCTVHDCGPVTGIVKPDPSNTHDSRAQAVIRSDGKLLGYIPRSQQDWYEDFNEQNVVCPFVGEIEMDSRSGLQAEIKVIIPASLEYVTDEIEAGL